MNNYEMINYLQEYLYITYPFIQWRIDLKKTPIGRRLKFEATNLVTNTTYSVAVAILDIVSPIYDDQVEYIKETIKNLVQEIKIESTKVLINRVKELNETI